MTVAMQTEEPFQHCTAHTCHICLELNIIEYFKTTFFLICLIWRYHTFKGTVSRNFLPSFFHDSNPSEPIWSWIRRVNDTGESNKVRLNFFVDANKFDKCYYIYERHSPILRCFLNEYSNKYSEIQRLSKLIHCYL